MYRQASKNASTGVLKRFVYQQEDRGTGTRFVGGNAKHTETAPQSQQGTKKRKLYGAFDFFPQAHRIKGVSFSYGFHMKYV
jgi:hypothetical protein